MTKKQLDQTIKFIDKPRTSRNFSSTSPIPPSLTQKLSKRKTAVSIPSHARVVPMQPSTEDISPQSSPQTVKENRYQARPPVLEQVNPDVSPLTYKPSVNITRHSQSIRCKDTFSKSKIRRTLLWEDELLLQDHNQTTKDRIIARQKDQAEESVTKPVMPSKNTFYHQKKALQSKFEGSMGQRSSNIKDLMLNNLNDSLNMNLKHMSSNLSQGEKNTMKYDVDSGKEERSNVEGSQKRIELSAQFVTSKSRDDLFKIEMEKAGKPAEKSPAKADHKPEQPSESPRLQKQQTLGKKQPHEGEELTFTLKNTLNPLRRQQTTTQQTSPTHAPQRTQSLNLEDQVKIHQTEPPADNKKPAANGNLASGEMTLT